jgi:hypothetical protein
MIKDLFEIELESLKILLIFKKLCKQKLLSLVKISKSIFFKFFYFKNCQKHIFNKTLNKFFQKKKQNKIK